MEYYSAITLLTVCTMFVLLTIVSTRKNCKERQRKGFILIFISVMVCAICEWMGEIINGVKFDNMYNLAIKIHILVKFIELVVAPTIPVICSQKIFEEKTTKFSLVIDIFLLLYVVTMISLNPFVNYVFYVDKSNIYHHADRYFIYSISFGVSLMYMFVNMFAFSRRYQNRNILELFAIMLFLTLGISIQFIYTKVKICWSTIAIATMFVYIYYSELNQCIDGLTALLNQRSFHTCIENNINNNFKLIIFDINDFKSINDNYGHSFGDNVIKIIGQTIKEQYSKYGKCFRIGGDEFAAVLKKEVDIDKLNASFMEAIEKKRKKVKELPSVSLGLSVYNPDNKDIHDIFNVKNEADKNMYKHKKQNKSK